MRTIVPSPGRGLIPARWFLSLLLLQACVASEPTRPARSAPASTPLQESIESQARAAAATSRPRREHQALAALAGTWDTRTVTLDPSGGELDPHSGRAEITSVFGGRYLRWDATLALGADTHATTGFLGFDVNQSEYQLLMISDLATGMGVARGRGDLAGQGVRFVLELSDPTTGAVRRAASVLRLLAPEHFVLDQFGADASGTEYVVRRTHYVRAAPR